MSKPKLSKEEAIRLITPAVDDEITKNEKIAFFKFIEEDKEVRLQYESAKRIKKLVADRYPSIKAPDTLRTRVNNFLASPGTFEPGVQSNKPNIRFDKPSPGIADTGHTKKVKKSSGNNTSEKNSYINSVWSRAAAAIVIIGAVLYLAGYFMNNYESATFELVGDHVYKHFNIYEGKWVKPTIDTDSPVEAEITLSEAFDLKMTVPPIQNTEFVGVIYQDFIPGFKTPVLEYHHKGDDQYIYIFAFNLKNLDRSRKLKLDENAVKACVRPKDFYVREINGKHIVSWKWNGVWYSAISNHDGQTLASLVEPLKYNGTGSNTNM